MRLRQVFCLAAVALCLLLTGCRAKSAGAASDPSSQTSEIATEATDGRAQAPVGDNASVEAGAAGASDTVDSSAGVSASSAGGEEDAAANVSSSSAASSSVSGLISGLDDAVLELPDDEW